MTTSKDIAAQRLFEMYLQKIFAVEPGGISTARLVYSVMFNGPDVMFSGRMLDRALTYLEHKKLIYKGSNNRWYAI